MSTRAAVVAFGLCTFALIGLWASANTTTVEAIVRYLTIPPLPPHPNAPEVPVRWSARGLQLLWRPPYNLPAGTPGDKSRDPCRESTSNPAALNAGEQAVLARFLGGQQALESKKQEL